VKSNQVQEKKVHLQLSFSTRLKGSIYLYLKETGDTVNLCTFLSQSILKMILID